MRKDAHSRKKWGYKNRMQLSEQFYCPITWPYRMYWRGIINSSLWMNKKNTFLRIYNGKFFLWTGKWKAIIKLFHWIYNIFRAIIHSTFLPPLHPFARARARFHVCRGKWQNNNSLYSATGWFMRNRNLLPIVSFAAKVIILTTQTFFSSINHSAA